MKIYYKSINNEANEWLAHELIVKGMKNSKPKLHLQACGRGFFKLCYDEKTVFWAKQHCCYYGVALLKTFDYESILSPIRSSEVEKRKALTKAEALESWSSYFMDDLKRNADELLYDGTWMMSAYVHDTKYNNYAQLHKNNIAHACIYGVEDALNETAFQQIDWFMGDEDSFVNLKKVDEYDGRLKWWRKKARENVLPPVVLLPISGLQHYIVLDGHYRLKAAYDEGVNVDILLLQPTEKTVYSWDNERKRKSILKHIEHNNFGIEKTNNLLLQAYHNEDVYYDARSRVFGSTSEGMREVITYLHTLDSMDRMQSFFNGEWNEE